MPTPEQKPLDYESRLLNQRIDYERKLTDQRFEMVAQNLQLQAAEYQRRLEELNHAHANAIKEQARVLPREIHDTFVKEYDLFRLDTAKQLQAISTRSVTWMAAIGIAFLIVSFAIRLIPGGAP